MKSGKMIMDSDKIEIELSACEDEFETLTMWEKGFIESIRDQFDRTNFLSEKQLDTLKTIYDKVV